MDPKVLKEVKALNRQRASCLGSVTKVRGFVESFQEQKNSVDELVVRVEYMNKALVTHDTIISQLVDLIEDDVELAELNESKFKFEEAFFSVKALLSIKITQFSQVDVKKSSIPCVSSETKSQVMKLPDIKIPKFNGDFKDWFTFRDTFIAIVHKNQQIEEIVKFTILIDRLEGDARATIGQIAMTSAGYKEAWQKLLNSYDDNQKIINYHIDKLISLQTCRRNSSTDLRTLINASIANVSAIISMDHKIEAIGEAIIIRLITTKLDTDTRSHWMRKLDDKEVPAYAKLIAFLQKHCDDNETNTPISTSNNPVSNRVNNRSFHSISANNQNNKQICVTCKQSGHEFYNCPTFLALTNEDRQTKAMSLRLCLNCMKEGHQSKTCNRSGCRVCGKKHNSLLHTNNVQPNLNPSTPSYQPVKHNTNAHSSTVSHNYSSMTVGKQILLSTAVIHIMAGNGKFVECRALLDSGSQSNFVSEKLSRKLNIATTSITIPIKGINSSTSTVNSKFTTTIKSKTRNYARNIEFLVVPIITESLPSQHIDISLWSIPADIMLADPHFNFVGDIDVLIGAELFFEIIEHRRIQLQNGLPTLQLTKFGWIICGKLENTCTKMEGSHSFVSLDNDSNNNIENIQQQLELFWNTETFPKTQMLSKEEQDCEEHFINTHTRTTSGRYVVKLPFNNKILGIGESKQQALRRFSYLERKLTNNPIIKQQYQAFMDEYIHLDHMEKVEDDISATTFYLPHHAVFKPDSTTTSCRVVFDGSAKSSTGVSLNDTLMIGGSNQDDLFSVMLRQRKYPIALVADVKKMYRQIFMHQQDMDWQRILWRNNPSEPITTYRLKTVTYGTASAPFLATRTLRQLALDEKHNSPIASQIVLHDFYVDDALTGANSIEEAKVIIKEMNSMLAAGGFKLHKWSTNSEETDNIDNQMLPEERIQPRTILISSSTSISSPYMYLITKFSYYTKMINTVAYCERFIINCRKSIQLKEVNSNTGVNSTSGEIERVKVVISKTLPPTPAEFQSALEVLITIIQAEAFPVELNTLKTRKQILTSSKLISLTPFLDNNNIIRVGGRLKNANIAYNAKHQYVIPAYHHFTTILIRYLHKKSFHAGPQLLLSIIRQQFWPIRAKAIIKQVVRSCIKCFVNNPRVTQQIMGDLPIERITISTRSFIVTGVDLSGPFNIKNRNQRKGTVFKTYVAHFVCLATKEVHFDLVSDLTSEAFIATLKRFLGSGKRPQQIISDNGTNFVGANNVLQQQHKLFQNECAMKKIVEYSTSESITWKFIPPRSPNFGGLWEATVKSFKFHLKRVINDEILTYEELYTLVKQIQGILNSRPLSPLSDDPNEPQPLTPAHFTCGGPPGSIDEPSYTDIPSNRLTHWKRISKMYQDFWKRFHLEYLITLQQRHKWKTPQDNIKINDIVLVIEDNTPPNKWNLGIVVETFIGSDGKCRVATVRSKKSLFKRPVSKLCKLPFEPSSNGNQQSTS